MTHETHEMHERHDTHDTHETCLRHEKRVRSRSAL